MPMMRAAVVSVFGNDPVVQLVTKPVPGPGQLLVQVEACGLCHTDLHAAAGDWPVKPQLPFIPGHEAIGVVAELGEGVTGHKVGDRVGVAWLHSACGACEYCVGGWETLCMSQKNTGYGVPGGLAEYMLADAKFAARLPEGSAIDLASVLCAGVTTYTGLLEADVRPGQWVAVLGIGGLGHMAVQYAKAMGLHVVAVDIDVGKLALARSLGADAAFDAGASGTIAEIVALTGGGVHGALVTAVSTVSFAQAVAMVRRKGTVSLVGLPPGDFPMPIFEVVLKRITIRGSIVGTRNDLAEALAFAGEGQVKAIVESRPLADVAAAFADLRAGRVNGRLVLVP